MAQTPRPKASRLLTEKPKQTSTSTPQYPPRRLPLIVHVANVLEDPPAALVLVLFLPPLLELLVRVSITNKKVPARSGGVVGVKGLS